MRSAGLVLDVLQCARVLPLAVIVAVTLASGGQPAWAGPAEEVAQLATKRGPAFPQGNLDLFMADFAENAVFTPAPVGFRLEGKQAIRDYFAGLFQDYPSRRAVGSHPLTRVYDDHTVIVNGYVDVTLIDRSGHVRTLPLRGTTVWVKVGGRWQIADQTFSPVPSGR
jgi:uncharacterized protein (TIGR02246 family)